MATTRSILQTTRARFVGLGRLGLCTALKCEQADWDIVGSDVFPAHVDSINEITLRLTEPRVEEALRSSKHLRATLKLREVIDRVDMVFILVATPTDSGDQAYDTSALSRFFE